MRARPESAASWIYEAADNFGKLEMAHWRGGGPMGALSCHFHDEIQVTCVLSGRRRFAVGDGSLEARAGQGIIIAAGTPHVPLASDLADAICTNIYIAPDLLPVLPKRAAFVFDLPRAWQMHEVTRDELIGVVARAIACFDFDRQPDIWSKLIETVVATDCPIGRIAASQNMSREGFTRFYARAIGMPPHAHRIAGRLNRARRKLRIGEATARVAAETGFADQSHLGRFFCRSFGVSPAAYRHMMSVP